MKIINMIKSKKEIIISFMIGFIVTIGVSYGVGVFDSNDLSYSNPHSSVTNVNDALDELIKMTVKASSITLNTKSAEMYVEDTLNLTYTILPSDTYNKNVKWTSSDENVATVEDGVVTAKKEGTATITVTTSNSKTDSCTVIVKLKTQYLADVVAVGDYVAYDAGEWTKTVAKPTSQGQFGGYTKDQNKANSVSECLSGYGSTTLKGWRVYSIDKSTKTVTLIHAGQPECYYHGYPYYSDASVTNLNNRATSTYLNSNYAKSAHMMNYDEALAITGNIDGTDNNLRATGTLYWLATAYNTNFLWGASSDGYIYYDHNYSFGVRPVVVLKSKILTTGKGTDKVGQEAWTLVKP